MKITFTLYGPALASSFFRYFLERLANQKDIIKKSWKIGEIPDNCEHVVVVVGGDGDTWLGGMVCRW